MYPVTNQDPQYIAERDGGAVRSVDLLIEFDEHHPVVVRLRNPYYVGTDVAPQHDDKNREHQTFWALGRSDADMVELPSDTYSRVGPEWLFAVACGTGRWRWTLPNTEEMSPNEINEWARTAFAHRPGNTEVRYLGHDILPLLEAGLPNGVVLLAQFVHRVTRGQEPEYLPIRSRVVRVTVVDAEYSLRLTAEHIKRIRRAMHEDLEVNYQVGAAHNFESTRGMLNDEERQINGVLDALPDPSIVFIPDTATDKEN